jgi:hypothetical protein
VALDELGRLRPGQRDLLGFEVEERAFDCKRPVSGAKYEGLGLSGDRGFTRLESPWKLSGCSSVRDD